jgi:hypothetical protein
MDSDIESVSSHDQREDLVDEKGFEQPVPWFHNHSKKPVKRIIRHKEEDDGKEEIGSKSSLGSRLFSKPGDIKLNGVEFHSAVLLTLEYFEKQFNMDKTFSLSGVSHACTIILKRYLYDQPLRIRFRKKLLIEILQMFDFLMLDIKSRFESGYYFKKKLSLEQELVLFQAGIDHEYQHAEKFPSQMSMIDIKSSPKMFELYLRHVLNDDIPLFLHLLRLFLIDRKNETLFPLLKHLNEHCQYECPDLKKFLETNFLNLNEEERRNNAFF